MGETFYDGYKAAMVFTDVHGDAPAMEAADGFSPALLASAKEDCDRFEIDNAEALAEYYEFGRPEGYAGHDFWLTRNGHGTGFWDRGLPGDLGGRLTDGARLFPGCVLYVGDDNMIHGS